MDKLHEYAAAIVRSLYDDELFVEQSDENSFDYAENLIRLNLRDDEDFGFMRHLENVHGFKPARQFSEMVWTLLHEIGHYETQDDYDDEEYEQGLNIKLNLACLPPKGLRDDEKLQDKYFNIVEEWVATEWAIDFVKHHKKLCKKWSKDMESLR